VTATPPAFRAFRARWLTRRDELRRLRALRECSCASILKKMRVLGPQDGPC